MKNEKIENLINSKELPVIISQICQKYEIRDLKMGEKIGFLVANVLLGKLEPEKLLEAFKKEGILPIKAVNLYSEIQEKIFSQVKEELSEIYKKRKR